MAAATVRASLDPPSTGPDLPSGAAAAGAAAAGAAAAGAAAAGVGADSLPAIGSLPAAVTDLTAGSGPAAVAAATAVCGPSQVQPGVCPGWPHGCWVRRRFGHDRAIAAAVGLTPFLTPFLTTFLTPLPALPASSTVWTASLIALVTRARSGSEREMRSLLAGTQPISILVAKRWPKSAQRHQLGGQSMRGGDVQAAAGQGQSWRREAGIMRVEGLHPGMPSPLFCRPEGHGRTTMRGNTNTKSDPVRPTSQRRAGGELCVLCRASNAGVAKDSRSFWKGRVSCLSLAFPVGKARVLDDPVPLNPCFHSLCGLLAQWDGEGPDHTDEVVREDPDLVLGKGFPQRFDARAQKALYERFAKASSGRPRDTQTARRDCRGGRGRGGHLVADHIFLIVVSQFEPGHRNVPAAANTGFFT